MAFSRKPKKTKADFSDKQEASVAEIEEMNPEDEVNDLNQDLEVVADAHPEVKSSDAELDDPADEEDSGETEDVTQVGAVESESGAGLDEAVEDAKLSVATEEAELEPSQVANEDQVPDLPTDDSPEELGFDPTAVSESSASEDEETVATEKGAATEEDLEGASDPAEASAPQGQPNQQRKPGLLKRLWLWLTKPFRRKAAPSIVEVAAETFDEAWRTGSISRLRELHAQKIAAADKAQAIQQQLTEQEQEQARVEAWLEGMKRSYYWKLEQKMDSNLSQAKSDIAEYESLVRALELPEKGTLRNLREKFHKGLMVNFLTFGIPVALLYFIPWFARADLFFWLLAVLNSPLFILLIVTIGAVTAGIFLLLRKVLGKQKVSNRRTIKWTLIAMLLPTIFYALFRFKDFLRVFVVPVIEEMRPTALWVIAILFVFLTLALLIIYYQGWSVFRRVVTDEVSRLENVAAGYVKTRQELGRLEFLYGQTIEWMRLLAHTLYRPWKIHPDWKSPNQAQTVSESFPLALRVAQAIENDASESAQLRRTIAHRLLVQGWRTEAFEKSLSEIGKFLGYEPDKVNPDLLDADLPHQPNNARKLVLDYFEHSASTSHEGVLDLANVTVARDQVHSKPLPSDSYLVEVARGNLRYLIEQTQASALAQARPSVQQIVKNPLAELTGNEAEAEVIEVSEWDDFLSEGLGVENTTQPPLGVLAFTDEGRKANSAAAVTSQVVVPARFAKLLPKPAADNLTVVSVEDGDQSTPAEVMLRLDLVGPLPFTQVNLIQGASVVKREEPAPIEENNDL